MTGLLGGLNKNDKYQTDKVVTLSQVHGQLILGKIAANKPR